MNPFELKKQYPVSSQDVKASWKHQVRMQVYFPLGLGLLLLALLIGLIILSQIGDESVWADIAVVLLFSLAIVLGIVGLTILVAAAIGVIYLIREVPPPFDRAREAVYDAQSSVSQASQTAVKPVIAPKAATYAVITGVRYLAGIFKR